MKDDLANDSTGLGYPQTDILGGSNLRFKFWN